MGEEHRHPSVKIWWRALSREQKVSVGVLSVCGVLAGVFAVASVQANLARPFLVPKAVADQAQKILSSVDREIVAYDPSGKGYTAQEIKDLKSKDTDHDGLSDYDEIFVYHTSPYLADSDSDGIPDGVEVARGTDPNCPDEITGRPCGQALNEVVGSATSSANDLLKTPLVPTAGLDAALGANASSTVGAQAFVDAPPPPSSMTAADIRAYLLAHHLVTQAQLDRLSDESLIQVYQAAYQEALQVQAASHPSSTTFGNP